ncbi:hypothetical protein [Mycolicibacterium phlei]|uniref:hypothetical protein n=1 Tax=Mycolicibacterium phlei TaxID=1771 RepID=UPI0037C6D2EA
MYVASRSYLAAGAALVSAGAIAVSPIAPPVPDVALPTVDASSSAFALSAAVNPIEEWVRVIETSLANVNTVGQKWLADPVPLLRQVLANQLYMATNFPAVAQALVARLGELSPSDPTGVPAMFKQFVVNQLEGIQIFADTIRSVIDEFGAVMNPDDPLGVPATVRLMMDQIAAGEFAQAVTTFASLGVIVGLPVMMAGFPIAGVLAQPFKDLANIVDPTGVASAPLLNIAKLIERVPSVLPSVVLNGLLGPVNAAALATATVLEDLVGAVRGADLGALVGAVINAPARIVDAFLNGVMAPGDFPMAGLIGGPYGMSAIGSVMDAIKSLAQAIKMPGITVSARQGAASVTGPETAPESTLSSDVDIVTVAVTTDDGAGTVKNASVTEEEPAAEVPVPATEPDAESTETVPADDLPDPESLDPVPTDSAEDAGLGLVRDSLKAEPGETGMDAEESDGDPSGANGAEGTDGDDAPSGDDESPAGGSESGGDES